MKFKEFKKWCSMRASDGCWSSTTAEWCIDVIKFIQTYPFWQRERVWKENYCQFAINCVVIPINKKIFNLESEVK